MSSLSPPQSQPPAGASSQSQPKGDSNESRKRDALASLRIERPEPYRAASSGRKRWWLLGLLLVVMGSVWGGYQYLLSQNLDAQQWLGSSAGWMPEIMQNRVEVRLVSVTVQQGRAADAVVVATGYLASRRQAGIGARGAGRVDKLYFEEGSKVQQGDLLAELEHNELQATKAASEASVARARAALDEQDIAIELAKVDAQRAEKLWQSRSIAEAEYDTTRFAYRTAAARRATMQAEIALAEAQLHQVEEGIENMFIRAPFAGTVISKDAELGESILPGGLGAGSGRGSVATIADLEHLQIECDVKEDFISRVSEGQEADISVDAVPSKKYHGTVYKIIPMGDRARATIKVQVDIDDADALLFPEMSGTAYFLPSQNNTQISDAPRIFCPVSSVATNSDEQGSEQSYVWVADKEKRAQRLPVTVGEERNGQHEVLSGLSGSERVISNPEGLQERTPLKIAE